MLSAMVIGQAKRAFGLKPDSAIDDMGCEFCGVTDGTRPDVTCKILESGAASVTLTRKGTLCGEMGMDAHIERRADKNHPNPSEFKEEFKNGSLQHSQ